MENISLLDFVSLPIYLLIIYFIAYFIRDRYYPRKHPWRKYFLAGLTIKLLGAIVNGLIHHYSLNQDHERQLLQVQSYQGRG